MQAKTLRTSIVEYLLTAVQSAAPRLKFRRKTGSLVSQLVPKNEARGCDQVLIFESMDGEPSRIFICIVSPNSNTSEHIKLMAEIGRIVRVGDIRDRLLNAATPERVVSVLSETVPV